MARRARTRGTSRAACERVQASGIGQGTAMDRDAAIGIFDSGSAGLACIRRAWGALPNEHLISPGRHGSLPLRQPVGEIVTRYASGARDFPRRAAP